MTGVSQSRVQSNPWKGGGWERREIPRTFYALLPVQATWGRVCVWLWPSLSLFALESSFRWCSNSVARSTRPVFHCSRKFSFSVSGVVSSAHELRAVPPVCDQIIVWCKDVDKKILLFYFFFREILLRAQNGRKSVSCTYELAMLAYGKFAPIKRYARVYTPTCVAYLYKNMHAFIHINMHEYALLLGIRKYVSKHVRAYIYAYTIHNITCMVCGHSLARRKRANIREHSLAQTFG